MDTQGNISYEHPVTYRQVSEIHQSPENVSVRNSIQSTQYDYIVDGFEAGRNESERDSYTLPTENQTSLTQPSPEYENITAGDYVDNDNINDGVVVSTIDTNYASSHSKKVTFCYLPKCILQHKILIALVIIIIAICLAIVVVLIVLSEKDANKDEEAFNTTLDDDSYHTTSIPPSTMQEQQTTAYSESKHTGPGSLLIIGGYTYNGTFGNKDTVQIYSVNDGHVSWKGQGRPAPYPWYQGGTGVSGSNIYIAGGFSPDANDLEGTSKFLRAAKYDALHNSWTLLPRRSIMAVFGPAVYVINEKLFVADGDNLIDGGAPNSVTERLDLANVDIGWSIEKASPTHQVSHTDAVVIGNRAYICAGTDKERKTVISWTYGESSWIPVAEMNIARSRYHGTVTDGYQNMWVVGGCDPDVCWPHGFVEQYSSLKNSWTALNQVPDIQRDFYSVQVCSYWQGFIYVIFSKSKDIGGPGLISRFYVYDIHSSQWHLDSTELKLPTYRSMVATIP